jgi:hypothetical protein
MFYESFFEVMTTITVSAGLTKTSAVTSRNQMPPEFTSKGPKKYSPCGQA